MQTAEYKKLYQSALSYGQSSQSLEKALSSILRLTIGDHSHFNFLLHNINWFNEPYCNHINVLQKALRLYKGRGKQSQKVAYNILADGMWSSTAWKKACDCLINLSKTGYDSKMLRQCLNDNYPHRLTQIQYQQNYLNSMLYLYQKFNQMGFQILQIIILQLASFDTELCTGDPYCLKTFPPDSQIKQARPRVGVDPQHSKFDVLLTFLLQQLLKMETEDKIFTKLLLIFKNIIIHINQTKYVQLVLFYFAQLSKNNSKTFVTFLYCEIVQIMKKRTNSHRVLNQLNNYLSSYIIRSFNLSPNAISKLLQNLMNLATQLCKTQQEKKFPKQNQQINLNKIMEENFETILIIQTVIQIWVGRPQIRKNCQQRFVYFLSYFKKQLYFQYFINQQLIKQLQSLNLNLELKTIKALQIFHKFNPPFLKRFSFIIDQYIRPYSKDLKVATQNNSLKLQFIKSQVKFQSIVQEMPVKKVKSQKKQSQNTQCST